MKQKLIELAKEKGFKPCIASISDKELADLFRLVEIQKWLIDEFKLYINCIHLDPSTVDSEKWSWFIDDEYFYINNTNYNDIDIIEYSTYKDALIDGLKEALNLLP